MAHHAMKFSPMERPVVINKGEPKWYSEVEVDQLRQVYKDHNIKLSRKQAKRLWDVFKDCNATTLIFRGSNEER